ncbi:MAG: dihydroorotate dehydrogenase electron transfer subunit [Dehalococcoidia bacterium]
MEQALCTISSNVEVMPGVHLMWIGAPNIASSVQPGQFVTVRCGDFTLRRPFSVHQTGPACQPLAGRGGNLIASPDAIGTKQCQIALLFKVTGKGTRWLSQRQTGEAIDILGPSGQGFSIPPAEVGQSKHLLLVAGGIGIAPLFFLMQHILRLCSGQALSQYRVTLIQGASTAAQLYTEHRQPTANSYQGVQFVPVSEDGSMGRKGMVTDVMPDFLEWADKVYACGPADMYKAMAEMSLPALGAAEGERSIKLRECQVSLEVRMGCGFGVCYGCTIRTRKGLKRVCRDGPVFELDDIMWQEVRI